MKSLIQLIMISFFIIAYVMVESSHGFEPTVSLGMKELTAKLDDLKISSKLMNIEKYSKHKCAKQMKEHIREITLLWLEADEAMEKKEGTKCEDQGGPVEIEGIDDFGMKIRQGHISKFGFKILTLIKTIFIVFKRLRQ